MGNRQNERTVDGVSYDIRQDLVVSGKPKSFLARFVTGFVTSYFGFPTFSIIGPIWYLLMANSHIAWRIGRGITSMFLPWLDRSLVNVKHELLKDVHGSVLDIGSGDGNWLKYLGNAQAVTALEPKQGMMPTLQRAADALQKEHGVKVETVNKYLHEFHPIAPFDYIILGNVLCEVDDPLAFLHDVDKMLKPGGRVVFQEHIRQPPGTIVGVIQDVFNWWWKVASNGCNCNRDMMNLLKAIPGWTVEAWDLQVEGSLIFDRVAVGIISKSH